MSKETEVTEIEVLTQEQIDALGKDLQEDIVYLSDNMNAKKLAKINPVIIELNRLQDRLEKLKFKPAVDGKYDKENIQEYKDLKANTRSFNTLIKNVAKEMKDPLNITRSHIINIEKGVLEEAAKILAAIDEKFKPYLDEVTAKAAAAQKKKDDALNAKILEAQAETEKANLKNKIAEVYNKVKYELIMEGISNKVSSMITEANENSLRSKLLELQNESFGTLISGVDISILEPEVSAELRSLFASSIHKSKELIEDKLKSIEEGKQLMIENAKRTTTAVENLHESAKVVEQTFPGHGSIPPPPPSTIVEDGKVQVMKDDFSTLNDREFLNYIIRQKKNLLLLIEARIETFGPNPELLSLHESLK